MISHQKKAIQFLTMVIQGEIDSAYEQFIAPNFIHHNQYFKGDRASLLAGMKEAQEKFPHKHIEIKKCITNENEVVTYSHIKLNAEHIGIAVVHVFRFEGEQVVELWDLGQQIMEASPNEHGIF